MITGLPNSRIPDSFLLAHMHACMLTGFIQEANRIDLFSTKRKDWHLDRQFISDIMIRAGSRFGGFYEKQYDPSTSTVTLTTDQFYDVVVNVGKKFAEVLKNENRLLAEHEAVGVFHELMQSYRTTE